MNKPNATESARQMHRDLARLRDAIDATSAGGAPAPTVGDIAEQIAHEAARLAGGEFRPSHNGWLNRETWNTNLWISNDPGTDEEAGVVVQQAMTDAPDPYPSSDPDPAARASGERRARISYAADALQAWWTDLLDADERSRSDDILSGPIGDALSYALAVTDWYSIAEGYAEGME